jgi:LysM repeat protein
MKQWKRLGFYLLLNILVSICATFSALFLWDQVRGPIPRGLLPRMISAMRPPTETPTPDPGMAPIVQLTPTQEFVVHQVTGGETFESIAEQHNMSVEELLALNGFTQSQPLGEGEVLRIPVRPTGNVVIDAVIGAGDLESERVLLKHAGEGELSLAGWRLEDDRGNVFTFPENQVVKLFKDGAINIYTRQGTNSVVDLFWGRTEPVWFSGATVILKDAQGNPRAVYKVP